MFGEHLGDSTTESTDDVVIFDRASRLGGAPEHLIRTGRFAGASEEMDALLRPALRAGRLDAGNT